MFDQFRTVLVVVTGLLGTVLLLLFLPSGWIEKAWYYTKKIGSGIYTALMEGGGLYRL